MEENKQTINNEGIENIYRLTFDDACKTMNTRSEGLTESEVQNNQ